MTNKRCQTVKQAGKAATARAVNKRQSHDRVTDDHPLVGIQQIMVGREESIGGDQQLMVGSEESVGGIQQSKVGNEESVGGIQQ